MYSLIIMNKIVFSLIKLVFKHYGANKKIFVRDRIDIYEHDRVLITGNSGAGKSTLLSLLKGIIPNYIKGNMSGEFLFYGSNVNDTKNLISEVGLLWQQPKPQNINTTVFNELAFSLENLQIPPDIIRQRINDFAAQFDLHKLLFCNLKDLSSSEQQMVNFWSLLIAKPVVILLDEPSATLDSIFMQKFIHILDNLTNITIIIVDHNIHYYNNIVSRHFLVQDDGEILETSISSVNWHTTYPTFNIDNSILQQDTFVQLKNINLDNILIDIEVNSNEIFGIYFGLSSLKEKLMRILVKIDSVANEHFFLQGTDVSTIKWKYYFDKVCFLSSNSENYFFADTLIDEGCTDNILHQLDIEGTRNPFALSEGQKRIIAFSLISSLEREFYIFDSVNFGVDYNNKLILLQKIIELNATKKTILLFSNDLDFLKAICNRVYCITENDAYYAY